MWSSIICIIIRSQQAQKANISNFKSLHSISFGINWHALSQSERRNYCTHIIMLVIHLSEVHLFIEGFISLPFWLLNLTQHPLFFCTGHVISCVWLAGCQVSLGELPVCQFVFCGCGDGGRSEPNADLFSDTTLKRFTQSNGQFPSCLSPLFQNESWW